MPVILEAANLVKSFGRVRAVADVFFEVEKGEILGLLGPNGSGKTTVFDLLTGVVKPDRGRVIFQGEDVGRESTFRRCRRGMGRAYQIPRPFGDLTVLENLLVAATHGGGLREKDARTAALEILEETGLLPVRDVFARKLPLPDRKRLEMARGLATRPSLLLLDEVAAGLTEDEAREVLALVRKTRERGVTVVWIEHLPMMMAGADRILVLDQGRSLVCSEPGRVMASREVRECYLGLEAGR